MKKRKHVTYENEFPMLGIRDFVVFPHTKVKFRIGRPRTLWAARKAQLADSRVFVLTQRDWKVENPTTDEFYSVGTIARVIRLERGEGETFWLSVEGIDRAELISVKAEDPGFVAIVKVVPTIETSTKNIRLLMQRVGRLLTPQFDLMPAERVDAIKQALLNPTPTMSSDKIASLIPILNSTDKQQLLETRSAISRLRKIAALLETKKEKPRQRRVSGASPGRRQKLAKQAVPPPQVFIGHGRNMIWARLQVFLENELGLKTINYESESRVGDSIVPLLERLLDNASFAILILTAEDETASGGKRARQNVIHEAGLFQGRLGFRKAILLKEEGTEDFTNIAGLQYILFRSGHIEDTFYELQRVLKREQILVSVTMPAS